MRFNKQELIAQASQTSQNFDREGVLILRERQDGFFRRSEGCSVRWFRLKGNLLFYLKGPEPWYEPMGVIVLGYHQVKVLPQDENEHWPFQIVWDNGVCYRIATFHESERNLWLKAIELASYANIKTEMADLKEKLNKIRPAVDIMDYRQQKGIIVEMCEVPLCELAVSCDNLLCDPYGKPPSPMAVIYVRNSKSPYIKYGATEIVEKSSNPCFAKTILFRGSDGLTGNTEVRILICDVREPVSETCLPMGFTALKLGTIQEAQRLRVALYTRDNKVIGFVTISGWSLEPSYVGTSPIHTNGNHADMRQNVLSHRRSQSLPPRLGVKVKFPSYSNLFKANFTNSHQVTYRFHSGLGGDIYVHEVMAEAKVCFQLPIQLLDVYIQRENELVQQLLSIGDICSHWKSRQTSLVATHLTLLKHYNYSKKALEKIRDSSFKSSTMKDDPSLQFAPVNLHLQRMWVHNDTLNKTGFHDVITVGAFAAHTHKTEKSGGLIRLVQQLKDVNSPKAELSSITNRIQAEYENIVVIRRIQEEVRQDMETIISVLQSRQVNDVPLIVQGILQKVGKILAIWDPFVIEETLSLIGWETNYCSEYIKYVSKSAIIRLTEQLAGFDLSSLETAPSDPSYLEMMPNSDRSVLSYLFDPASPGTSDDRPELQFHEDRFENDRGEASSMSTSMQLSTPTSDNACASTSKCERQCSATLGQISYKSLMQIFDKNDKRKIDEILKNPTAFELCHLDRQTRENNLVYFHKFLKNLKFILSATMETAIIARERQFGGLLTLFEINTIRELMDCFGDYLAELVRWLTVWHSAMRLRCESPQWMKEHSSLQIRRDTCFSQALTAVTTGLMCWLCSVPSDTIVKVLSAGLGPLCGFEGLLTLYAAEKAMWGDMVVAIEDLQTVVFTLSKVGHSGSASVPNVSGIRNALVVNLPVSEFLYSQFTSKEHLSFTITAVFFNIGINDKATLAEASGETMPQYKSNCDNLERLNKYYQKYNKIFPHDHMMATRASSRTKPLEEVMENLKIAVQKKIPKNVEVIQLASLATRIMNGVLFTSCKSAKDRTGMAVTLGQCSILSSEYHLAEHEMLKALHIMRSEGCRRENTLKNIGVKKYAFTKRQLMSLPEQYRPPAGTYGSSRT